MEFLLQTRPLFRILDMGLSDKFSHEGLTIEFTKVHLYY